MKKALNDNIFTEDNEEPIRQFSSIFRKDIAENEITKAINEETIMEIDKDSNAMILENKRLNEQIDIYIKQLEDISKENDDLTIKIEEFKHFEEINKDLENLKDEYERELEVYREEFEKTKNETHLLRSQVFENKRNYLEIEELKEKINVIEKEKNFMIENTLYFKEEMAKNYNFYNEELEKTKKEYIQSKINYSLILMEFEYISLRCKQLEQLLKQHNIPYPKK